MSGSTLGINAFGRNVYMHSCSAMALREHLSAMYFDWGSMIKIDPPCDWLLAQKGVSLVCPIPEAITESFNIHSVGYTFTLLKLPTLDF